MCILNRKYLFYLLGYPIFQIIGTLRHEGAHAVAAYLTGGGISKFVFLPSIKNGRFLWGYVQYIGPANWFMAAAPYILDIITFVVFYLLLSRNIPKNRTLWIIFLIIGILSPLINTLYNYIGGVVLHRNDVAYLMSVANPLVVSLSFIFVVVIYIVGIIKLCKKFNYGKK